MPSHLPAAVIGSGPNGLAAAVTLARAGVPVTVFETAETIGGGTRTLQSVQHGVWHDQCSAIHPMAFASGFFREFGLDKRMSFITPDASYAHPLDGANGDRAAIAYRDLERTAAGLGRDARAYTRFYTPLIQRIDGVLDAALGGGMLRLPADLLAALVLGLRTAEQGSSLWNLRFIEAAAPALLTGVAAHNIARLPNLASAGAGIVLGLLGHTSGWPVPVGGSQRIAATLAADLMAHGGEIRTEHTISDVRDLGDYGVVVFDTSARGLARIAQTALPPRYLRKLERFRFGDGATKVDFVLDGPVPWRDPRVAASPTVHLGGSRAECVAAERAVSRGEHPEQPYVLLAQPDGFDLGRNPTDRTAVWSYTHVPHGSTVDVRERVIKQIERFAPGFRDRIVAVKQTTAAELAEYNSNYVGGDFGAGALNLRQLIARPKLSRDPWRTPAKGIYLASSSTPPGPGVHGLGGWYAALSALRHEYGLPAPDLSPRNQ